MRTDLATKVATVNKANAYAMSLYKLLAPIFTSLVGEKIEKNDGGLMVKVAKLVPALAEVTGIRVYRRNSSFSLSYVVQASTSNETGTTYHEVSVYIGDMEGATLIKMAPAPDHRTDFTVEEIERKQKTYEIAQASAQKAQDDIPYQFR